MPRKSQITSEKNDDSTTFQTNIKKWIEITQQIINLEKQLEVLREQQMSISHECVNLTSNLSQEIKINTLIVNKEIPAENDVSVKTEEVKTEPKKPVRRKRRTKAEIEQERNAALAAKEAAKSVTKKQQVKQQNKNNKSEEKKSEENKQVSKKEPISNNDILEENSEEVSSSENEMDSSDSSTELDSLSSDSSSSESSHSEDEN
tara:strand:+ start:2834 stop:3445 length:612 start_codon:yes stop_codon:yes gene_type:complete